VTCCWAFPFFNKAGEPNRASPELSNISYYQLRNTYIYSCVVMRTVLFMHVFYRHMHAVIDAELANEYRSKK